jgi:uncharacterized membrane protein YuzA (DUF378 family)
VETKLTKISLVVLVISGIVWLGGVNIRAMVSFDLLQTSTLDFKPNIHPYVERAVFGLVGQSSMVVNIAYTIVWLAGIIYLKTTKLSFREHGWLMMSAILFYMFTPVEIYTIILDFKMWYLDYIGSNDLVEFRKLFIHRLAALSGVPLIALLCYYSVIVIVLLRPLRHQPSPAKTE